MTTAAHGRISIGGSHKDGLIAVRPALYPVRRVTGETLHSAMFIEREYFRYCYMRWHHLIDRMAGIVVKLCPGIPHAAIMTGKAHLDRCHHLLRLILD